MQSSTHAIIVDMERALAQHNLVYALRLIHTHPKLAPKLRQMWQQQADREWQQELMDDAAQLQPTHKDVA